ncbi:hypothetical protein FFLO_02556 [Filobasidium floriforme]|uniref:Uncharacterized protein n=1 Tax=Filobasidium floriforme TaxID=5210 RepID=A0A8K0JSM3_9TREE|nr:hypothetical protein FFLO_02556 [Filobasidium floriforme]
MCLPPDPRLSPLTAIHSTPLPLLEPMCLPPDPRLSPLMAIHSTPLPLLEPTSIEPRSDLDPPRSQRQVGLTWLNRHRPISKGRLPS